MATIMNMLPNWFTDALVNEPDNRYVAGRKEYESVVDPEYLKALKLEEAEKQNSPSTYYAKKLRNIIYGGTRGVVQNVGASLYGANEFMKAPIGEYFQEGGLSDISNRATEKMMERSYLDPTHEGKLAQDVLLSPFKMYEGLVRAGADQLLPHSKIAAGITYGVGTGFPIQSSWLGKAAALRGGRKIAERVKTKGRGGKGWDVSEFDALNEVNGMMDTASNAVPGSMVQKVLSKTTGVADDMSTIRFLKSIGENAPIFLPGFYSKKMRVKGLALGKALEKGIRKGVRTWIDPDAAYKMKQSGLSAGAMTEIQNAMLFANTRAKDAVELSRQHGSDSPKTKTAVAEAERAIKTIYAQLQYSHIFNLMSGRTKVGGKLDEMGQMFQLFYPEIMETRGIISPKDAVDLTGVEVNHKFLGPLLESAYGEVGFNLGQNSRVIYGSKSPRGATGVFQNELNQSNAAKIVADFVDNKKGTTAAELQSLVDDVVQNQYVAKNKKVQDSTIPRRIKTQIIEGREYIHYVINKAVSDQLIGGIRGDYLLDPRSGRVIELISDETNLLGGAFKAVMDLASNKKFATIYLREHYAGRQGSQASERDIKKNMREIAHIQNTELPKLHIEGDRILNNSKINQAVKDKRLNALLGKEAALQEQIRSLTNKYPFSKYSTVQEKKAKADLLRSDTEQYARDVSTHKKQVASGEIRKNARKPVKPNPRSRKYSLKKDSEGAWDQTLADDLLEEITADPNTPLRYTLGRTLRNTLGADIQGVGIRERAREERERNELEL